MTERLLDIGCTWEWGPFWVRTHVRDGRRTPMPSTTILSGTHQIILIITGICMEKKCYLILMAQEGNRFYEPIKSCIISCMQNSRHVLLLYTRILSLSNNKIGWWISKLFCCKLGSLKLDRGLLQTIIFFRHLNWKNRRILSCWDEGLDIKEGNCRTTPQFATVSSEINILFELVPLGLWYYLWKSGALDLQLVGVL